MKKKFNISSELLEKWKEEGLVERTIICDLVFDWDDITEFRSQGHLIYEESDGTIMLIGTEQDLVMGDTYHILKCKY